MDCTKEEWKGSSDPKGGRCVCVYVVFVKVCAEVGYGATLPQ